MKIHIFDVELKDIPNKNHPVHHTKGSLLITPYNKRILKAGENKFLLSKVTPINEPFNLEKLEEIAVFTKLDTAKEIAIMIACKEENNFISH